jgi:hypothetical protein
MKKDTIEQIKDTKSLQDYLSRHSASARGTKTSAVVKDPATASDYKGFVEMKTEKIASHRSNASQPGGPKSLHSAIQESR